MSGNAKQRRKFQNAVERVVKTLSLSSEKTQDADKQTSKAETQSESDSTGNQQILHREKLRNTFGTLATIAGAFVGVWTYYHLQIPFITTVFICVVFLLCALYQQWHTAFVKRLCFGVGLSVFIGCCVGLYFVWKYPSQRDEIKRLEEKMKPRQLTGVKRAKFIELLKGCPKAHIHIRATFVDDAFANQLGSAFGDAGLSAMVSSELGGSIEPFSGIRLIYRSEGETLTAAKVIKEAFDVTDISVETRSDLGNTLPANVIVILIGTTP